MVTTIQLDKRVKDRLKRLKIHPRESYDKVVERLIKISSDEGILSEETKRNIERSLEDARAGRTLSMEQVKRRFRINYHNESM